VERRYALIAWPARELLLWTYDQAIAAAHRVPIRIADFFCVEFGGVDRVPWGHSQCSQLNRDQDFDRLLAGN
jgi:hypothetical protein